MGKLAIAVAFAALLGAGSWAGVSAVGGGGCHAPRSEAAGLEVRLAEACFSPTVLHVQTGATVTWTNAEAVQHNVVGVGGEWGQGQPLDKGASFSATFAQAGIFPYFCSYHPGMVGVVAVGGDGAAAAPAPEEGGGPAAAAAGSAATSRGETAAGPAEIKGASSPRRLDSTLEFGAVIGLLGLVAAGSFGLVRAGARLGAFRR